VVDEPYDSFTETSLSFTMAVHKELKISIRNTFYILTNVGVALIVAWTNINNHLI